MSDVYEITRFAPFMDTSFSNIKFFPLLLLIFLIFLVYQAN